MKITVHSSKVIYDKAIEVNYEFKLNGDEQQDDKKNIGKINGTLILSIRQ